jgi:hypothetical protein
MIFCRASERLRLFDDRIIRRSVGTIISLLSVEHHEVTHRGRRGNLLLKHRLPVSRPIVDRRHEEPICRKRQHDPTPQPEPFRLPERHEIRPACGRTHERLRIQLAQSLSDSLTNHLHTHERKSRRLRVRSVNPPSSKRDNGRMTGLSLIRHVHPNDRHDQCTRGRSSGLPNPAEALVDHALNDVNAYRRAGTLPEPLPRSRHSPKQQRLQRRHPGAREDPHPNGRAAPWADTLVERPTPSHHGIGVRFYGDPTIQYSVTIAWRESSIVPS